MVATVVYSDPNSQMARRRLSLITLSLFVLIIILTTYSYLHAEVEDIPSRRHHYSSRGRSNSQKNSKKELDRSHDIDQAIKWLHNGHTLTRRGDQLKFNPHNSCPSNSLMMSKRKRSITNECPKVFIVGAKKGGTTSLYQYISEHPDFSGIRLNETKWIGETFYFAQKYGKISLKSYIKQFPKGKMSGDASVDNLLHCKVPIRISRTCGTNVKVIVLLRNPLHRYISNFMMRIARSGYSKYSNTSSIHETVKNDIGLVKKALLKRGIGFPRRISEWPRLLCLFECCRSMLYEGLYYIFVMNWLCNFPRENILFINSEEMFRKPDLILEQVLHFIGLKPLDNQSLHQITSSIYNKGVKPFLPRHHLSSDDKQMLLSYYSIFNEAVINLLGWNQLIDWS